MIDLKRFIVFLALLCKLEARAILDVESYQIRSFLNPKQSKLSLNHDTCPHYQLNS